MNKIIAAYILASQKNGTIYVGSTSDLARRVDIHKSKVLRGFSEKYGVDKLVYYEVFDEIESARYREYNLKNWRRLWKLNLIESVNPDWEDLSFKIV